MIGSTVLLYPDAGPGFQRALRTAVLYSDRVGIFTGQWSESAARMLDAVRAAGTSNSVALRRIANYLTFSRNISPDLRLLSEQQILLKDLSERHHLLQLRKTAGSLMHSHLSAMEESRLQQLLPLINEAFDTGMPCYSDLEVFSLLWRAAEGDKGAADLLTNREALEDVARHCFAYYLVLVAIRSEQLGAPAMSWAPAFQRALWAARTLFPVISPHSAASTETRALVEAELGHTVLATRLPLAEDLPLEELLELRSKRRPELESFRVALRDIATTVDLTAPPNERALHIRDLVASRVDPAVDELKRSLRASRLDILKRLGRSSSGLGVAAVSATLALATGAPMDVAAAVAAITGVLGTVADAQVESHKIMGASRWAVVLRFDKARRRR